MKRSAQYHVGPHLYVIEGLLEFEGDTTGTHDHDFGHATEIPTGAARIEKLASKGGPVIDSKVVRASDKGGACLYIEAGVWHRITALEPGTMYRCWYSLFRPGGDAPEVMTWQQATR